MTIQTNLQNETCLFFVRGYNYHRLNVEITLIKFWLNLIDDYSLLTTISFLLKNN